MDVLIARPDRLVIEGENQLPEVLRQYVRNPMICTDCFGRLPSEVARAMATSSYYCSLFDAPEISTSRFHFADSDWTKFARRS